MKASKKMHKLFLLTAVMLTVAVGCTKRRPDRFAQGQGKYLKAISDYEGKEFALKTGPAVVRASTTTSENVVVEKGQDGKMVDFVEEFPLVTYSSSATLLPKEIELRARPNTSDVYTIKYEVTRDFLKVFKVAQKEDIPFEERTSAEVQSDGRLAVPLVGYPLELISTESALNSDNERTNQIIEQHVQQVNEAQYFRINETNFQKYSYQDKSETFPISFFGVDEGTTWDYAETIVSGTDAYEPYTGLWVSSDSDHNAPARVKFVRFGDNELKVVNAVTPVGKKTGGIQNADVISIPAKYLDYRPTPQGSEAGMAEEVFLGNHYTKRKFVQLNLSGIQAGENSGAMDLTEVRIAPDYFSFVVETKGQVRLKIRYSFHKSKKNDNYKPKYGFRDDLKTFGAITRQVPFDSTQPLLTQTINDVDQLRVVTRHASNNIDFYIGATTDDKYIPYAEKAVALWNSRLEQAGSAVRLNLHKEKQALGDVRYNIVDFVEPAYSAGWAGVSTSVVDEKTGEIISTIAQIQVSAIRAALHYYLEYYVNYKLGVEDKYGVGSLVPMSSSENLIGNVSQLELAKSADTFKKLGFEGIYFENNAGMSNVQKVKGSERLVFQSDAQMQESAKQAAALSKFAPKRNIKNNNEIFCSTGIADADFVKSVETLCAHSDNPDVAPLTEYLSQAKVSDFATFIPDKQVLDQCVEQLLMKGNHLTTTAVHEIGHSIGLAHNFKGSADKANFYPESSGESGSSSIMDYFPSTREVLVGPGKYDTATVKYIYDNKVELRTGQDVKIRTDKDLGAQGLSQKIRPFLYCSDSDAARYIDPLCQQFDSGSNVVDVTNNYIEDLKIAIAQYSNRLYRAGVSSDWLTRSVFRRLLPMRRIYDEWRYYLASYVGQNNQYLEKFSKEDYQKKIDEMMKDPKMGATYKQYYQASRMIFNFLYNDLYFLPNRYCVGTDSNGVQKAVEMEKIRAAQGPYDEAVIEGCASTQAQNYLNKLGLKNVKEIGYDIYSSRDRVDVMDTTRRPYDNVGTIGVRMNAMYMLVQRASMQPLSAERGFTPNFIDEPDFRDQMERGLLYRTLRGVRLPGYDTTFAQFEQESDLVTTGYYLFKLGLSIPGKPGVSVERGVPYQTFPTQIKEYAEQQSDYIQFGSLYIGVPSPQNNVALALVKEYKADKNSGAIKPVNMKVMTEVRGALEKLLPPTKAEQKQAHVGNALSVVMAFEQIVGQHQDEPKDELQGTVDLLFDTFPELKNFYENVDQSTGFSTGINQLAQLTDQLKKEAAANGGKASDETTQKVQQIQGQLQQLMSRSLYGMSSQVDEQFSDFYKDAYLHRLDASIARRSAAASRNAQSPEEVEAQSNLILRILTNDI